jgi:DeoR family ulaG and ulaABCDEF operon transcriptional repressor
LLKRAETLVVLADSRKLRQRSSMIVAGLDRISVLITDDDATEDELQPFRSAGIRVIQAAAAKDNTEQPKSGLGL